MKIVKTKWSLLEAINLFGILFTKSETEINHEAIHTAQMKEMLYIFFYLWYAVEYVIIWFANLSKSQHEVSFEEEANYYESNLAYLRWRKHYEWFKYIGLHSNE